MKSEEIYNAWKEQKNQFETSPDFPDKVMNQIHNYEQAKRKPLFDVQWLIDVVSTRPLVKAAMIAAGAIGGIIRAALMLYVALGT